MAKRLAAWWWIDRWRKSTAYTDMTLAEQGAYRNLLDELWLRGGVLPNDERILAKVCGDPFEWPKVRKSVLARFQLTEDGWRNDTHDEVSRGAGDFRGSQSEKGRKGAQARWHGRANDRVNGSANGLPSPSPSPVSVSEGALPRAPEDETQAEHTGAPVPASALQDGKPTGAPAETDLAAYLEALREHHPRFADDLDIERALYEVRILLPPLQEFTRSLIAQARSPEWREESGRYATKPARWLRNGGWRNAARLPEVQPKPKPRGVEQARLDSASIHRRLAASGRLTKDELTAFKAAALAAESVTAIDTACRDAERLAQSRQEPAA